MRRTLGSNSRNTVLAGVDDAQEVVPDQRPHRPPDISSRVEPHPVTGSLPPRLVDVNPTTPGGQSLNGAGTNAAKPTTPHRSVLNAEDARAVQRRLADLGYLAVSASGNWGERSREALRAFKSAHQLAADDAWDQATELKLFEPDTQPSASFAGVWGVNQSACLPHGIRDGLFSTVINEQGASAEDVSCAFKSKRLVGNAWTVVAACSGDGQRWNSNVRLAVAGDRLKWSSERGTHRRDGRDGVRALRLYESSIVTATDQIRESGRF